MAIESSPFGGTTLTGADAEAFERQIAAGPDAETLAAGRRALDAGRAIPVPENTWFTNSLDVRRRKMARRIHHLRQSLSLLKKQDSDFAEGHRLLIAAYEDELATLDRHRDAHVAAAS